MCRRFDDNNLWLTLNATKLCITFAYINKISQNKKTTRDSSQLIRLVHTHTHVYALLQSNCTHRLHESIKMQRISQASDQSLLVKEIILQLVQTYFECIHFSQFCATVQGNLNLMQIVVFK